MPPAQDQNMMYVYLAGLGFVTIMLVFVFLYIIIYQQRMNAFNRELQQKELERQHQVFDALIAGEEKERKRLAEELHDGVGARLSGAKMNMEYLTQLLSKDQQQHAQPIYEILNETIDELRAISHNLQPSVIGVKGLKNALSDFMATLNKKQETQYQLFWNLDGSLSNAQSELNIYRISTELLHNIAKHAKATQASLQLITSEGAFQLIAEDNGIGFEPGKTGDGIGLINLRNRIEHEKGKLIIDSHPDSGTTIIVEFPLSPAV